MSEKEENWMKLDEHGKQKHMGCDLTPAELHAKLTQGKTRKWEQKFRAVIKEECGGLCVLVCKQCNAVMSANPSKSFTNHKCSGAALAKAEALRESPPASPTTRGQVRSREEDAAGTSSMEPAAKKAGPLDSFIAKPGQAEQVHRMLAIHLIKREKPFTDVECPALRQAFAAVGI